MQLTNALCIFSCSIPLCNFYPRKRTSSRPELEVNYDEFQTIVGAHPSKTTLEVGYIDNTDHLQFRQIKKVHDANFVRTTKGYVFESLHCPN